MRVDRGRPWSFLCCDRCTHSMYQPNCRTLHPNASNLTKVEEIPIWRALPCRRELQGVAFDCRQGRAYCCPDVVPDHTTVLGQQPAKEWMR